MIGGSSGRGGGGGVVLVPGWSSDQATMMSLGAGAALGKLDAPFKIHNLHFD